MNVSGEELALAHLFCKSCLSLSGTCDCSLAVLKRIKNINVRNKLQMSRDTVHCCQSTVWVLPQATPTRCRKVSFDQIVRSRPGHLLRADSYSHFKTDWDKLPNLFLFHWCPHSLQLYKIISIHIQLISRLWYWLIIHRLDYSKQVSVPNPILVYVSGDLYSFLSPIVWPYLDGCVQKNRACGVCAHTVWVMWSEVQKREKTERESEAQRWSGERETEVTGINVSTQSTHTSGGSNSSILADLHHPSTFFSCFFSPSLLFKLGRDAGPVGEPRPLDLPPPPAPGDAASGESRPSHWQRDSAFQAGTDA